MRYKNEEKTFKEMPKKYIDKLDKIVKEKNKNNFVKLIDITKYVKRAMPTANVDTRFTPYCMLRLYADVIPKMPDKILYLDNDVVALKDPKLLYQMDIKKYDVVGVLDYYGSNFFKKKIIKKDYLNSGVLLMNMVNIRKRKVFLKARKRCQKVKMLLPDQSALNKYAKHKKIVPRIYNEQKRSTNNTVFRHFSTTFKFWPTIHTQTIKPWHIDKLHDILNEYRFDDILDSYQHIKGELENE
jgi:lipopolysaccharide biosynthesis glycosyltransferase